MDNPRTSSTPTPSRGGARPDRRLRRTTWLTLVAIETFALVASLLGPAAVIAKQPSPTPPPPVVEPTPEAPPPPAEPTPEATLPPVEEPTAEPEPVVTPEPAPEVPLEPAIAPAPAPEQAPAAAELETPTIASDKADYYPGSLVTLTGTGWAGDTVVAITVNDDLGNVWYYTDQAAVQADGTIVDTFYLSPTLIARYDVVARGLQTERVATASFTDGQPPAITLEQCRNGTVGDTNACADLGAGTGWGTANVGGSQAHLAEGLSIPYRAVLDNLPTDGTVITLVLGYDIKHSSAHALDFLTHYDRLEPHVPIFGHTAEDVLPTSGTGAPATFDTYQIPVPDTTNTPKAGQPATRFNSLPAGERLMTLFGGDITNVYYLASGDLNAAQSETRIAVEFTATSADAVLAWGGHIARCLDWGTNTSGDCLSASGISGSPYHMRLIDWNLNNLGNQDRSMSTDVVFDTATKSGVKFNDYNANGVRDTDEPGLEGWTIYVDVDGNGAFDLGTDPYDVTDSAGAYEIAGINPGTYRVREVQQEGWFCSLPTTSDSHGCYYEEVFTQGGAFPGNDFGNYQNVSLTISKDANTSLTRTYSWTITKDYDGEYSLAAGESVTHGYLVAVDQTVIDGSWAVQGSITIENTTSRTARITGVSDVISPATSATVDCGVTFPHDLPPAQTLHCTYSATLPDAASRTNTVTVDTSGSVLGGTASADVDFTNATITTSGYPDVNVTDTNGQAWTASGDDSWSYDKDFTCSSNPADYTNGSYDIVHPNTATITETGQDDDATVTVHCSLQPLVPTKTAAGEWDRTVTWELAKSVDDASHTGYAGDPFDSTWTVVATKIDSGPQNYRVTGTISVFNPSAIAQTFSVSDVLDDGTVAEVTCPSLTVAAGETVICTYLAEPDDDLATSNTATITFTGNLPVSASDPIEWTENLTGSDDANLTDPRFPYDQIISGTTTVTDAETFTCSTNPARYTNGSYTETFTNTAYLVNDDTDLTRSASVTINCSLQPLVPTKTAAGEWDRTVTWELAKSVDDASHTGYAGDPFDSTWTVVATKIDSGPQNYRVTGTISVFNPSAIAQTFSVSDVLDDGTVAEVTCPSLTVAAGETVICTYLAEPDDDLATSNTATITFTGNLPVSASDPIEWTENLTGSDDANLTDPRFPYDQIISGTTTVTDAETFTCSTNPARYTNGSYTETFTNTAYLVNDDTDLTRSASVTINCSLQPLVPTKTAAGEWDRTVTWELAKSVDDASHTGYAGDPFDSTWTVVATKIDSGPQNYRVTGTISVFNPSAIAQTFSVSDVLDDGTVAEVTCPSLTVAAGETVICTYLAEPDDDLATSNTATITFTGNLPVSASDPIEWTENLTGSDDANLTDPRFPYDQIISGTTTVTDAETFTCSTNPARYTNGSYTETFTNTAYLVNDDTDLTRSASVTINCSLQPLVPTKTAAGEWDRTVTWELAKSVDDASHTGYAGDPFDSTWTVVATKIDSGPQNYRVTGTISVFNPSAIAQTFSVSDVLDDGTVAEVTCPSLTVAAGETVICTYLAEPDDDLATSNTATITFTGNLPVSASDPIEWTENLTGSDDANLTDPRFPYDQIISGTTTVTDAETFTCSTNPARYTNGSYTETFTNTAYLVNDDTDLTRSASVTINCSLQPLVPTKTAAGEWDRTVTWELAKSVDDASHTGYAGDPFDSTWTVVATKIDSGPQNYRVTGTISVFNPSAIAQTFSVSDVLDDGTVAEVTCPSLTVAAGETVICTYLAEPDDDLATSNTATITFTGNLPVSASDPIEWTENLTGSDDANLTDPRFPYDQIISGTTTVTDAETFTCSTNPARYTNGSYTETFTNTAYLVNDDTDLTRSASVTIRCYLPMVDLTKTGDALSKIGDDVTYTITLDNDTPVNTLLRNLSCTVTDTTIGFSETVSLAGDDSETWTIPFTIPDTAGDPFVNTASVTCLPLNSTFSVSDSATWETNLFVPVVEIIKDGPTAGYPGEPVTYTFTINNLSSADSPDLILDTLTDTVLGDLADDAPAACDQLAPGASCTFQVTYTVPVSQPFGDLTNVVTAHYHPADFPNDVKDSDSHTITIVPKTQLTDTSFCPLPNNQFRLVYALESGSSHRLNQSNPGQFYFNGFYTDAPGTEVFLTFEIPYPFVTQGAVPIQIHDDVWVNSSGCYVPSASLTGYTVETDEGNVSPSENAVILLSDYGLAPVVGTTTTKVTVAGVVPDSGLLYVTIHLDYGLKRTGGWTRTGGDNLDATNLALGVTIADPQGYAFDAYNGKPFNLVTPTSINVFKKSVGPAGQATKAQAEAPVPGAVVELWLGNKKLNSAVTDEDGYYYINYKHTGKATTFNVKMPAYKLSKAVVLKANGFVIVDFSTP